MTHMYFSARTEGHISYGHLGRTSLLLHEILKGFQHLKIGKHVTVICTSDARFIALKAPENVWRPGSARTRWGSLSAPPDPPSRERGRGERRGEEEEGRVRKREWKGGEGRGSPPTYFAVIRPLEGREGTGEGRNGVGRRGALDMDSAPLETSSGSAPVSKINASQFSC